MNLALVRSFATLAPSQFAATSGITVEPLFRFHYDVSHISTSCIGVPSAVAVVARSDVFFPDITAHATRVWLVDRGA